jgi:hypothetical protein
MQVLKQSKDKWGEGTEKNRMMTEIFPHAFSALL